MRNPVQPPELNSPRENGSSLIDSLYKIEPVLIRLFWDDEKAPETRLENPNSSRLIETLSEANLRRATVVEMQIGGVPVDPRAVARLNWFLHVPGFEKGFRGWKRKNRKERDGVILWKSREAWTELKQILGIAA